MLRFLPSSVAILLLATILTVFGCGVMPAGQASTRTFTVTGFTTLPVTMVYAGKPEVSNRVAGIAANEAEAKAFVERLVMQTVFDVLDHQGRSALLPDIVISSILSQVEVKTTYAPMQCQEVLLNGLTDAAAQLNDANKQNCIIAGNTVTGICTKMGNNAMQCMTVDAIPANHMLISGSLSTSNIIMANWSRTMWQTVFNRAIRMLASGRIGLHIVSASVNVGGN
ncbi:hypothetical protein KIN20_007396 [Parelaphostrongylus tenuis]|uniref:Lipoprotein n=1 Tax=Parelaphostrongylus tenuis TaxID=148309 RepID=A0AAD5QM05_PARTN|nr:hypothetical protein KIN20_007396 [Parelaphostrongylus tenuis]